MSDKAEKLQAIVDMQSSHIRTQDGEIQRLQQQIDDLFAVLKRVTK